MKLEILNIWESVIRPRMETLKLTQLLALFGWIYSLIIFLSYLIPLESVYRVIEPGPATNPLTSISFVLLAGSIFLATLDIETLSQRVFAILILIVTFSRIMDGVMGTHFHDAYIPFDQLIAYERHLGLSNVMGINTAIMLFLVALSLMFLHTGRPFFSFILAVSSMILPLVAFIGYVIDLPFFYGDMSISTMILGIATISSLLIKLRSPFLDKKSNLYQTPATIHWGGQFSVGDQVIDSQHQKIVSMINYLIENKSHLKKNEVYKLLIELQYYAKEDLACEEKLLLKHNYPDYENHVLIHQFFVKKVDILIEQAHIDQAGLLDDMLGFLTEWWAYHILEEDMEYKPYLEKTKNAPVTSMS